MIKKIQKEKTPFEKYFMEAPGDQPNPNINIRSVVADKRLSQYANDIEDDEAANNEPMELVADDEEDYTDSIEDDDVTEPELVNDEPDETNVEPETGDEAPDEPDTEDPVDAEEPNAEIEDPDVDDDGLETDDGTGEDYADDIEDDTGEEPVADDGGNEGEEGTVVNNKENQLKFSLYRKFRNLYDVIKNYQERIDSITTQSYNYNMALKTANNKLVSLENLLYDYMTLRFRDESYIASMEFYQRTVITVKLIFEVIRLNKENQKATNKTIN